MKKYLLLTTLMFITTSCTTVVPTNWNTTYIDTNETLKLYYGMPKDDVLSALGNPLYVKKGWPDGKTNEIYQSFFCFSRILKKNIKITPFSFHLCILSIFKARALKIWLQVGLRIDPKSYFMGHDP